ncbi:MAG: GWxTD domain-containing protein [Saprospiraceae bacterium]
MKKIKLFFLNLFFFIIFLSQSTLSYSIDISVNKAAFQYQDTKYLEIYLQVIGSTVNFYHNQDSLLEAGVDITLILEKNCEIYNYEKFQLNSPNTNTISDFISLRRFKIENGKYLLKVSAVDIHDSTNTFNSTYDVNVDLSDSFCISDIQLLASISKSDDNSNPFVKNGYYMESVLYNFLPYKVEKLGIYFEIYNEDKAPELKNLNIEIENSTQQTILTKEIALKETSLQPVLTTMNISALESGTYTLKIIRGDSSNKILKQVVFLRSNPTLFSIEDSRNKANDFENSFVQDISDDSLMYSLKAILPLVTGSISQELNGIITEKNIDAGKYFLWRFWEQNKTISAERSYKEYMNYARYVDNEFRSQVGYGFETDRGYIFLKYGRPSEIITERVSQLPHPMKYGSTMK